jgi:ABC-type transport system involved in cytochrome bd biosynthesis fused ATPase/permease subunit
MVGQHFHAAAEGAEAADKVFAIMEQVPPTVGTADLIRADVDLWLDELTLDYGGDPVVVGLSAVIPAGRVTLLRGVSGAGKTTVLNALLGFLTPARGRVLVGEQDLADVDIRQWWDQVAWVPQNPQMLPATIRENLTLGEYLDVEEVLARTRLSSWVASLPEGLDTVIGEGGRPVSVGQARRISLARALLRGAQVLMLDEPTAGVDHESEQAILETLPNTGATVIVVGHRGAVGEIADQVVEIGVVV